MADTIRIDEQNILTPSEIIKGAEKAGTPCYLYDEAVICNKCRELLSMPNAFGINVHYAMKANSSGALLQLIHAQGLGIDASSLNEVRRAHLAGIPYNRIVLTTQEVPVLSDREELEDMILKGLSYNACSIRQLQLIADFAGKNAIPLSIRVHPGVGSGESITRNTGDKYSCFGIHLSDLPDALAFARQKKVQIDMVHVHIGSGGDPKKWQENIDREMKFVEDYFPDATKVNFGGGLKQGRMPDEVSANIKELGMYAKKRIEEFYQRTHRKLILEIEPGTYVIASAGFLITRVIDKKQTGKDGFQFIITDGGMEVNARPLLYGSRHPFYLISKNGELLSSEYDLSRFNQANDLHVIAGRCCESGDSQCLDEHGHIVPRLMADPEIGDYAVIGSCGAYCASMSPFNYNSHTQAPEILLRTSGEMELIRKKQTLKQIVENEILPGESI
ncbi:MAG: diaminopimelate decarboxylase [Spirochaetales bacterium]|nr:diaminopimelate decarboxylase [Spirochaetales bacterium]